ncbi:MAG: DUF1722 domain-containing protein [Methanotrichaceae archaeon]|nr:DUF1722 domain-containing protein [Methanotrichaceae archaeon]
MRRFSRPRIVISKCIEFDHCRYDGSMIGSEFVRALKPHVDFIPVCAEVEIGLGIPRDSIRIVSRDGDLRLVQPATGLDVTAEMRSFTGRFLDSLSGIDGFILKYRSPSCGLKGIRVYQGLSKSAAVSKTAGFFGGPVSRAFSGLALEDEGRLRNFNIREHYLTKVYALAGFRAVEEEASISALIEFHTLNKLLLAAQSQKEARVLGNIVANRERLNFAGQSRLYREHLRMAFSRPMRPSAKANVLMHAFGYFSNELSAQEKAYFLQSLERYRKRKVPSTALVAVIQSWIARFGQDYLRCQTFFEPFPEDLRELCLDRQCEWAADDLFEPEERSG